MELDDRLITKIAQRNGLSCLAPSIVAVAGKANQSPGFFGIRHRKQTIVVISVIQGNHKLTA